MPITTGRGRDHNARKTECPRGHPYDAANTARRWDTGARTCKACDRLRHRKPKREKAP